MNRCGECSACCKFCDIDELYKPSGVLCENYDKGCKIYENRPLACSTYQCLWHYQDVLGNSLDVKYRPDNLGVIFEKPYKADFWMAVEIEDGAIDKQETFSIIKAIERDGNAVYIKRKDGKQQYNLPQGMSKEKFDSLYDKYTKGKKQQWQALIQQT